MEEKYINTKYVFRALSYKYFIKRVADVTRKIEFKIFAYFCFRNKDRVSVDEFLSDYKFCHRKKELTQEEIDYLLDPEIEEEFPSINDELINTVEMDRIVRDKYWEYKNAGKEVPKYIVVLCSIYDVPSTEMEDTIVTKEYIIDRVDWCLKMYYLGGTPELKKQVMDNLFNKNI